MSVSRAELHVLDQRSRWLEKLVPLLRERGLRVEVGRIESRERQRRGWVHMLMVDDRRVGAFIDADGVWTIRFGGTDVGTSQDITGAADAIAGRLAAQTIE